MKTVQKLYPYLCLTPEIVSVIVAMKKGKKMYRIKVIIDTSAEKLIAAFENSDDITKWNTTLSKHQILKKFDNTNATISYQVTRVP